MGIKGLESFAENHEEIFYEVDIPELVQRYLHNSGEKTAEIVVDLSSCVTHIFSGHMDGILGHDSKDCDEKVCAFVNAFYNIPGVRITVFSGGCLIDEKRATWEKRQMEGILDFNNIRDIVCKKGFHYLNEKHNEIISHRASSFTRFFVKYSLKYQYGVNVVTTLSECDTEIMEYAKKNHVFAVLSQDSDFMICNTAQYYLSCKYLNLQRMKTKVYDGRALAQFLGLNFPHLPIFATLCGNDMIMPNKLREFHKYCCSTYGEQNRQFKRFLSPSLYIPNVAKFLRTFLDFTAVGKFPSEWLEDLRNQYRICATVDELLASIDSYESFSDSHKIKNNVLIQTAENSHANETWLEILECAKIRHLKSEVSHTILETLTTMQMYLATKDFHIVKGCVADVYLPIRVRMYGVLFEQFPKRKNVIMHEWKPTVERKSIIHYASFKVQAAFPLTPTPGLLALWSQNGAVDQQTRLNLFFDVFCPKLKERMAFLYKLDPELILPTAVVFYLLNDARYLNEVEAKAIVAVIAVMPLRDHQLLEKSDEIALKNPQMRVFELNEALDCGMYHASTVNSIVGFAVPMLNTLSYEFSYRLLHVKYARALALNADEEELYEYYEENARRFQMICKVLF